MKTTTISKIALVLLASLFTLITINSFGQNYTNKEDRNTQFKNYLKVDKGFLAPRYNTADREALEPAQGTLVYDTDELAFYQYDGDGWELVGVITGEATRIPYFGSVGQLTNDAGFVRDSIDGLTSISSINGADAYTINISPHFGYMLFGKVTPTDTTILISSGNTIQLAAQGEEGLNRIKAEDEVIKIEIKNAARLLKTNADFDTLGVTITTDSIFKVVAANVDTVYSIGLVKGEASYFQVLTPITESSVYSRKDISGLEYSSVNAIHEFVVDSGAASLTSESKLTGVSSNIFADTNNVGFTFFDELGNQNNYRFPVDTGSIGQILSVGSNDGFGNTTLGWQDVGGGCETYCDTFHLTSNQILNGNGSPKLLIADPGAGKFIEIISASYFHDFQTAEYGTATNIQLYCNGSTEPVCYLNNILDGTSDGITKFDFSTNGFPGNITLCESEAVYFRVATTDPVDGDCTGTIYVQYRIVTL